MWYTMSDPNEILLPEMESEPFSAKELKTVEAEFRPPNGPVIKHSLKIPAYTEIRLKHGLFLTVDLANDAIIFTKAGYPIFYGEISRVICWKRPEF